MVIQYLSMVKSKITDVTVVVGVTKTRNGQEADWICIYDVWLLIHVHAQMAESDGSTEC